MRRFGSRMGLRRWGMGIQGCREGGRGKGMGIELDFGGVGGFFD